MFSPNKNISLEGLVEFNTFRLRKLNRLPDHLLKPVLLQKNDWELPRSSVYHYLPENNEDKGPSPVNELFNNIDRTIPIYHFGAYDEETIYGSPRVMMVPLEPLMVAYHQRNKKYRRYFQWQKQVKDVNVPFVFNHALSGLKLDFTAKERIAADYNKNHTVLKGLIQRMVEVTQDNDFNQFVIIPTALKATGNALLVKFKQDLQKNGQITRNEFKKQMTELGTVLLFHLFLFAGDNQELSLFSLIPKDKLDKINIIIRDKNCETILNLGFLEKLRKTPENKTGVYSPAILSKRIQFLFLALQATRNSTPEEIEERNKQNLLEVLANEERIRKENKENKPKPKYSVNDDDDTPDEDELDDVPETTEEKDYDNTSTTPRLLHEDDLKIEDEVIQEIDEATDTINTRNLTKEYTEAELEAMQLKVLEDQLEAELNILDAKNLKEELVESTDISDLIKDEYEPLTPEQAISTRLEKLLEHGDISPAEVKKYEKMSTRFYQIAAPNGDPVVDFIKLKEEDIKIEPVKIDNVKGVTDENMVETTLKRFKSQYIDKVYMKDIYRMMVSMQQAGLCIKDIKIEEDVSASGSFYNFRLSVEPIIGQPSNVYFRLPILDKDGVYSANGTEYFQRSQLRDKPIRKVTERRVALTSYYGKIFIERSEKRAHNYERWLNSSIRAASLDKNNNIVRDTRSTPVFNHQVKQPFIYSTLAKGFKTIETHEYYFYLDHGTRENKLGKERVIKAEDNGKYMAVGVNKERKLVVVGYDDKFYLYNETDHTYQAIAYVESIMGLKAKKVPIESAEITVMGKSIPVGIAMAYEMGLSNLLKRLNVPYKRIPNGTDYTIESDEFEINFMDETLVFSRRDRVASLVMAGFLDFQVAIKDYSITLFDKPEVYLNVLETQKITTRYLNEINMMYDMFIDPITLDLLRMMKEPLKFRGLLLRACELLTTDYHPKEVDASQMRIVGEERLPGIVYGEMVKSIRYHRNRGISAQYGIELNPKAVEMVFSKDPARMPNKGLNPIAMLKQQESITFSGVGGRSSQTMVERTREYDEHSLGTISESTVDSGIVGVNVYMSANPSLENVYGFSKPKDIDPENPNYTRLMSTSCNLSVASEKDDSKRRTFIAIMNDHTVPCTKYSVYPVRTGYEQVIAHRTSKLYATTAEQGGKVLEINKYVMKVQYEDGTTDSIKLGRLFGSDGGLTIPHTVITKLKAGDTFKKDDVISYNPAFFEPEFFNGNNVSWKAGVMARVLLCETSLTIEDSSAISKRLSDALMSYSTKVKNITVDFNQEIHKLVKVGDEVEVDSFLCFIEDEITSQNKMFDEESIEALKLLGAQAPKAGVRGRIERIEVFYNGDKEDMSDSIREITDLSDHRMAVLTKATTGRAYGGRVGSEYRVKGKPLELDQAVIKVYITSLVPAHSGDKGVISNQLKTVFGKVYPEDELPYTEDGQHIDTMFGAKSVAARIVESAFVIGTATTLLLQIGKNAADIYFGNQTS